MEVESLSFLGRLIASKPRKRRHYTWIPVGDGKLSKFHHKIKKYKTGYPFLFYGITTAFLLPVISIFIKIQINVLVVNANKSDDRMQLAQVYYYTISQLSSAASFSLVSNWRNEYTMPRPISAAQDDSIYIFLFYRFELMLSI